MSIVGANKIEDIKKHFNIIVNPFRVADREDIADVVELWANYAAIHQLQDYDYWNWEGNSSQIWANYIKDFIKDERNFLVICDFGDNGLSGFLQARIEKLPPYYTAEYKLTCQEFYIRPKEKCADLMQEMIIYTLAQAQDRFNLPDSTKFLTELEVINIQKPLLDTIQNSTEFQALMTKYTFKYKN